MHMQARTVRVVGQTNPRRDDVRDMLAGFNGRATHTAQFRRYRALIVELYCQPGQWETQPESEARAAYEYFRASLAHVSSAEAN